MTWLGYKKSGSVPRLNSEIFLSTATIPSLIYLLYSMHGLRDAARVGYHHNTVAALAVNGYG